MSTLAHVTDDDQVISGEVQTINISGAITLAHPPDPDDAITIPGYTQVNTPIVNTLEFFVNYANSVISFNASQAGVAVAVSYTSLGEQVNSALINPIIDAVNAPRVGYGYEKFTFNATAPVSGKSTYNFTLSAPAIGILGASYLHAGGYITPQMLITDLSDVVAASVGFGMQGLGHTGPSASITVIDPGGWVTGTSYTIWVRYLKAL